MTTYKESAYSDDEIRAAVKTSRYKSFKRCVSALSTKGKSLTEIAVHLGLNPQKFWAYYKVWCEENVAPLSLGDSDDE